MILTDKEQIVLQPEEDVARKKRKDTPEETEETKTNSPGKSATKKIINAKNPPQRPISTAVRMKNNEQQWHRVWPG